MKLVHAVQTDRRTDKQTDRDSLHWLFLLPAVIIHLKRDHEFVTI